MLNEEVRQKVEDNWERKAGHIAADFANAFMFPAHRGAMAHDLRGMVIVFGNDGYGHERTQQEVEFVRERLAEMGGEETAFGTSHDGYSWAIIASVPDDAAENATAELNDAVWAGWRASLPAPSTECEAVQRHVAEQVISNFAPAGVA